MEKADKEQRPHIEMGKAEDKEKRRKKIWFMRLFALVSISQ